jgi:hypothetical protein
VKFMDMHGVSAPTRKRLYHTRGGRVLGHHGGGEGKRHSLRAGTVIEAMDLAEVTSRFLDPIFKLEDEEYWALLSACATDSHVPPMVAAQVLSGNTKSYYPRPTCSAEVRR